MEEFRRIRLGDRLGRIGYRSVLAAFGWWVISEGQIEALWAGVPAIVAAVALSLVLAPGSRFRIRPLRIPAFLGYFLTSSLLAGLDVARRILHPTLPIDPAIVRIPLTLPHGGPRWFLANTLNLLPGTLCILLEDDAVLMHCLDVNRDPAAEVRSAEQRVARLFGMAPGSGS